jgi:hypothetical protein
MIGSLEGDDTAGSCKVLDRFNLVMIESVQPVRLYQRDIVDDFAEHTAGLLFGELLSRAGRMRRAGHGVSHGVYCERRVVDRELR